MNQMEYELIQSLGNCLDNVYNNHAESHDRRTIASIKDDMLCIEYQTILRVAKDVVTPAQLFKEDIGSNTSVYQALGELVEEGKITKEGRGRYLWK